MTWARSSDSGPDPFRRQKHRASPILSLFVRRCRTSLYVQLSKYKVFHVKHFVHTMIILAAPARAAAAHALVATAVAHHDGAAERATGSVAHVDHAGERVGGVDGTSRWSLVASRWAGTNGAVQIADTFRKIGRAHV